jgi:DNA-binding IclR family transcriptional regulator
MVANANTVQATETSFRVLEALIDRDGAGVSDLAEELDLSRSGVHKHLTTLCELGYVRKDGDVYRVDDRFFGVATRVRAADPLFEVSHEPLVSLASAMNERVSLYRRRGDRLTCLFSTADRNQPGRDIPEGREVPVDGSLVGGVTRAQEGGAGECSPDRVRDQRRGPSDRDADPGDGRRRRGCRRRLGDYRSSQGATGRRGRTGPDGQHDRDHRVRARRLSL